ncbi:MAG: hypothetical protein IJ538_00960 [Clostridia bacterium]|nr:hypothetical protein [Clostridia bacterium]
MAIKFSSYSMKRRLSACIMLVTFFVCVIFARLIYIQVINRNYYISQGLTEWLRDLPLIANRGGITDRNGVVLASSYTSFNVYVRPADVESFEDVSRVLSDSLGIEFKDILEKISNKNYSEIKIATDIDKDVVQKILKNYQKGIFFTTDTKRNYSYNELLCQILGFTGADNSGQAGLEAYYNEYLKGINGVSLVESDLRGKTLNQTTTLYTSAIDGLNLELTIDFRLQKAVEKIVDDAVISTGAKSISVIITNPQNGEILSIATLPSYNLNEIPRDDIKLLNSLSRASTIVDTFEPGSTFKAIVAAIALEEGITSKHDYFYCGGYRIINGVRIKCARRSGHGSQSLEQGLMNSCNCVFMDLIQRIGLEKFYSYLDKFGFTAPFGIDFPGEVSAVLMPKSAVTAADLARMGFGQTIAISSLEMAVGVGAVINGGYVLEPHFLKSVRAANGNVIYEKKRAVKNQVISENTSALMREMLYSVVEKGGGKYAKVEGYNIIGGKTGTAQKYENGAIAQGKYIASFLGFAPYDNPEYLVFVSVDEPVGAYYGGVVAAPIAKNIFEEIFKMKNLTETAGVEVKDITLPTFIGLTLTEASALASSLGIQYLVQGDGDYVTGQVASPGTMLAKNDIVLLIFN